MRTEFSHFFPHSRETISELWKQAAFVFDANTLLNLYRYSDTARDEFLSVLREMRDQIRVPEQAAHEYFKNRPTEIVAQDKSYSETRKAIDDLRSALTRDRGHPFISEASLGKLNEILAEVCNELDQNQKKLAARLYEDEIMAAIAELFDSRVGPRFSSEDLEKIFSEGEARFAQKVPPGYNDSKKHQDPKTEADKRSVYGDLIIWKQLQSLAIESKAPVVFVTDDAKDDWWLEVSGKTIGPRPELLSEFMGNTQQKFHMYRPEQFLKYAKDHLESSISKETIDEVAANQLARAILDSNPATKQEVRNYFAKLASSNIQEDWSNNLADDISKFGQGPIIRKRYGAKEKTRKYSRAYFAPIRIELMNLSAEKGSVESDLEVIASLLESPTALGDSKERRMEVYELREKLVARLAKLEDEIADKQIFLKTLDEDLEE